MARLRLVLVTLLGSLLLSAGALTDNTEDLVGRLLLLAFTGDGAPLAQLTVFEPAGFLFYPSNITSTSAVRAATRTLQDAAPYPLLFGVDQEGGPFNAYRVDSATLFPGNMALAAGGDVGLARAVGRAVGTELAYAGLNLNFGPVVDVNISPDNPIIGVRSFGADPATVAAFGTAYASGLEAAGVAAVAKHFPGHGDTATDSHLALPTVGADLARLNAVELPPFAALVEAGVPAVMTAHVTFPVLDPDLPATLSPAALTELLRGELGFEGLIVTDFMDMRAIADNYGPGEAAVLSVIAGADLVLLGPDTATQQVVYNALKEAISSRRLSRERVRAAVAASAAVAKRYPPRWDAPPPDYAAHQQLALGVATNGATLLHNEVLPLLPEQNVLVVSPRLRNFDANLDLGTVVARHHAKASSIVVSEDPTESEIEEVVRQAQTADVVVLGSYHWQGAFPVGLVKLESQLASLNAPLVIVALGNPDDLRFLSPLNTQHSAAAYLAVYGFHEANLEGAWRVLSGENPPRGVLPVAAGPYELGAGMTGF